jgi:predicted phage tail protein
VSSLKTYYYRVRAYNGAGNSAYTSALGVGTPGLPSPPPAAPTNVAASNKGDGSAVVAWVDSSTNETKFEVRREKWDAKRSIWSGASVIGTLPSNLTSMVDLSGNGTFRYSVRAVNDGGTSPSAGPAPVTVTGGASKGRGGR